MDDEILVDRRNFLLAIVGLSVLSFAKHRHLDLSHLPLGTPVMLAAGGSPEHERLLAARVLLKQHYRHTQWLVIEMPIAFLQRNLRLGYSQACQLARMLERSGDWSAVKDGRRWLNLDQLL